MKKITVRLSTLMEILTQMEHDNVDFVEMDLVGDAVDCGQICPAFVELLGVRKTSDAYIVDYGCVDEISREDLAS